MDPKSLQERFAPHNHCFGCGPANPKGLGIRSFPDAQDEGVLVATWQGEEHHEAFDGMLNGGICGALLDCHSNWAAAWHLMRAQGSETLPCTVTADFHVKLRRPTPSGTPLVLRAEVIDSAAERATVQASISAGGEVTATCRGLFVAVREGHPAFHRW